jgi:hypothetical protein
VIIAIGYDFLADLLQLPSGVRITDIWHPGDNREEVNVMLGG